MRQAHLTALALLSLGSIAGCKKDAASYDAMTNHTVTPQAKSVVHEEQVIDTTVADSRAVTAPAADARKLPAPAPDSADAGLAALHRAVALIQTGRTSELATLLTPAAQAQLAKAGGARMLERYKASPVEFASIGKGGNGKVRLAVPVRLHIGSGASEQLRDGVVLLVRDGDWRIDELRLEAPAKPAKSQ